MWSVAGGLSAGAFACFGKRLTGRVAGLLEQLLVIAARRGLVTRRRGSARRAEQRVEPSGPDAFGPPVGAQRVFGVGDPACEDLPADLDVGGELLFTGHVRIVVAPLLQVPVDHVVDCMNKIA